MSDDQADIGRSDIGLGNMGRGPVDRRLAAGGRRMVETTRMGDDPGSDDSSIKPGSAKEAGLLGQMARIMRGWMPGAQPSERLNGDSRLADIMRVHGEDEPPAGEDGELMFLNLLKFRTQRVADVMVPRADIVAVDVGISFPELIEIFKEAGHSRLPIYKDTLDDPIGMVHLKDVVACMQPGGVEDPDAEPSEAGTLSVTVHAPPSLERIRHDILSVPASMRAMDLLVQMQAQRKHMALVIDEYGGTDGLVTIEDLIELIIGDIEDEHDKDVDPVCERLPGGGYLVDARLEIADFEAATGVDLALDGGEEDEVDTLGGLVFTLAERVPRRGEIISHPNGFDIEIVDADPRRIRRMKIVPKPNGSPAKTSLDRLREDRAGEP